MDSSGTIKIKKNYWSLEDTRRLLDLILKDTATFERPNATMYYSKLVEEDNFFLSYGALALKDRMRTLKLQYTKAIERRNAMGDELNDEYKACVFKEKLEKKCPCFQQLDAIYGERLSLTPMVIYDSTSEGGVEELPAKRRIIPVDFSQYELGELSQSKFCTIITPISDAEDTAHSPPQPDSSRRKKSDADYSPPPARKLKKVVDSNLLIEGQRKRLEILKEKSSQEDRKIAIEEEKLNIRKEELSIERERLQIEADTAKENVRLRELEINNAMIIKKMELEQQRYLMEKELDLKYKNV